MTEQYRIIAGFALLGWLIVMLTLGLLVPNIAIPSLPILRTLVILVGALILGESFVRRAVELRYGYRPDVRDGQRGEQGDGDTDDADGGSAGEPDGTTDTNHERQR